MNAQRIYRNPLSVLKAAQRKIGGRIITYDGTPVLAISYRGDGGLVMTDYLSDVQAAEKAKLRYAPQYEEEVYTK